MTAIVTQDPASPAAGRDVAALRSAIRATITLVVFALIYEAIARSGYFPAVLMPTLGKIGGTLLTDLLDGTMLAHAAARSIACWSAWRSRSWWRCRSAS